MLSPSDAASLSALVTEGVDARFQRVDDMATMELAILMNDEDANVAAAIRAELSAICTAIDEIATRMAQGGRLCYVGAGTPGRIGILDASECVPTFGVAPDVVSGLIAGGKAAFVTSVEGAEDDETAGARAMADKAIGPLDSVVGLSASGRTPYVLGAVIEARRRGAYTVGISCNPSTSLSCSVDCGLEILVGPEVLAGSTRLKAGTAQKMVLNMISTITMVKLGHTYQNRLVDMLVVNGKLHQRAIAMVADLAHVDQHSARDALDRADGHIKTAVLMLRQNIDVATARRQLEAHGGRLRSALGAEFADTEAPSRTTVSSTIYREAERQTGQLGDGPA